MPEKEKIVLGFVLWSDLQLTSDCLLFNLIFNDPLLLTKLPLRCSIFLVTNSWQKKFLMKNKKKKRLLNSIGKDFFDYLGRHLPQQCASDEFYLLPRSEAAIQHSSSLDDLAPEKIQDYILYAQNLLNEIPQVEQNSLEYEIDRSSSSRALKAL